MTESEFFAQLQQMGVQLWVEGERVRYSAPKGILTPVLRAELTERKTEILAFLRQANVPTTVTSPPLVSVSRKEKLPLSFSQQQIWFLSQLDPNSPSYNIPLAFRLTGHLNVIALEQTFNAIVRRQEVFRTTCSTVEGQPVQIIAPALTVPLPLINLQEIPKMEQEATVRRLATQAARQPFDLTRGPLLRVRLLRLDPENHVLLLTTHHFVADGWSLRVFLQELSALYEAFSAGKASPLRDPVIQYADFAHWQRLWLQGDVLHTQMAYWKKQLEGAPAVLELPTDWPRSPNRTNRGASESLALPAHLSVALKELSRQEGVTLFMTLLAAFKALLYRYTGQDDIIVGTAVSNRNRIETEDLIGPFANNLFLRTNLSRNPTFRELLARVREVAVGAYAHQDLPFEKLVQELQPKRRLGYYPLVQVMFIFHQHTLEQNPVLPGLTVTQLPTEMETAKYDLFLRIGDGKEQLFGSLEYSTELFDAATIKRMVSYYLTLLEGIIADPEQRLSELVFVLLDSLPLPTNDKVSSQALPAPDPERFQMEGIFEAPRDALEHELAEVWRKILGLQSIGVRDNFFELGGNSLLAVRLFAAMEERTGKKLPLATLFQAPTIEQLASVIREKDWSVPWNSLVAIQPRGSKPPLFCVHAHEGNVLFYRDLARYLGADQPFYGLQAQGLDGKQTPLSKVEDMAARYIKEIRSIQPKGPYFLGGYCFGGLVAFELARKFDAERERVALLALFDTYTPEYLELVLKPKSLLDKLRFFIRKLDLHLGNLLLLGSKEKLDYVKENIKRTAYWVYGGMRLPLGHARQEFLNAMDQAFMNYHPQVYAGRLTLFRGTKQLLGYDNDPQLGWGKLAAGGVEIHRIPGYDGSVILEPRVRVTVEKLRACLLAGQPDEPLTPRVVTTFDQSLLQPGYSQDRITVDSFSQ
jgi:thioesterase domain-containing protein/acyl carrier protein